MHEGYNFSTSLLPLAVVFYITAILCEIVSHCGFNLHFLDGCCGWVCFPIFFKPFGYPLQGLSRLDFTSSVYTLEVNPLLSIQSALHIHRFCIHGFNQTLIEYIWGKNFQKDPKSKTWICHMLTTTYIAFTLYLKLFTLYLQLFTLY